MDQPVRYRFAYRQFRKVLELQLPTIGQGEGCAVEPCSDDFHDPREGRDEWPAQALAAGRLPSGRRPELIYEAIGATIGREQEDLPRMIQLLALDKTKQPK
jgi:hypothetical protein